MDPRLGSVRQRDFVGHVHPKVPTATEPQSDNLCFAQQSFSRETLPNLLCKYLGTLYSCSVRSTERVILFGLDCVESRLLVRECDLRCSIDPKPAEDTRSLHEMATFHRPPRTSIHIPIECSYPSSHFRCRSTLSGSYGHAYKSRLSHSVPCRTTWAGICFMPGKNAVLDHNRGLLSYCDTTLALDPKSASYLVSNLMLATATARSRSSCSGVFDKD